MNGPRQYFHAQALALSALLLLPACSVRKPIPSDPPEVRTEAQVRGQAARAKAQEPAPQAPQAVSEAKAAATPTGVNKETAPAVQAKSAAPAEAKGTEPKADVLAPETKAEGKTLEAVTVGKAATAQAPKAVETKAQAAAPEATAPAGAQPKAEPAGETKSAAPDVTAKAQAVPSVAADPAQPVAPAQQKATQASQRGLMVQIASFSSEKYAQGALSWLREKGYSEARLVRVEQDQTVYQRVQVGPFQDPAATHKALEELKTVWPQAFIPVD